MRFGFISLGENEFPGVDRDDRTYYREYLELAELVDELDYTSIWVGEHHFGHVASISSPVAFLSAMATRTTRVGARHGGQHRELPPPDPPRRGLRDARPRQRRPRPARARDGLRRGGVRRARLDIAEARDRFRETMAFCDHALNTRPDRVQGPVPRVSRHAAGPARRCSSRSRSTWRCLGARAPSTTPASTATTC